MTAGLEAERDAAVAALAAHGVEAWAERLPQQWRRALVDRRHGDLDRWLAAIAAMPVASADAVRLDAAAVTARGELDAADHEQLRAQLMTLKPWRKGPYDVFGVAIDTEWRSDWKWDRLAPHLSSLAGRRVLDVGCGNGYHCWRMAGAGASLVVGIDPTQLFLAQFLAIRRLLGGARPVHFLPLGIEQVPAGLRAFDTVFSMGVLYHRRSPFDHLMALRDALRPGGELVLETLVIDGGPGQVLVPAGRYAKMRNVWFLPSVPELLAWLTRVGFQQPRAVDVSVTTVDEQRATPWMDFESLADYLDPSDPQKTCEGHPAPRRAIIIARA